MSKPKYVARDITDLKDMLEQTVALYSDKEAFVKKAKEVNVGVNYKKFKEDVFSLATELLKKNIDGERVVLLSENRYEWCVSFMGVACSKGIIVPLSTELDVDEIVSKMNVVKAKFVIFSEKYRDLIKNIKKRCPNLEVTIDMDTIIDDADNLSLLRLIELGSKEIQNGNNEVIKMEITSEQPVAVFFEDTLVKDKGVMLSQKNLVSELMGLVSFLPISSEDKLIILEPLSSVYQCVCSFLTLVFQGGTIYFSEKDKEVNDSLKEVNPTVIFISKELMDKIYCGIWNRLGTMPNIRKVKILMFISNILIKFNVDFRRKIFKDILKDFGKNLNLIVVSGKEFLSKVMKDFYSLGINMFEAYKIPEASSIVMINGKKEFIKDNIMGMPLPGIKTCVLNSNGKVFGEITLKSDSVMLGYYDDKKATAKVIKDKILYTGKIGARDKNGCFYYSKAKNKRG